MDNPQWPQGTGVFKPVEKSGLEKKPRPQKEQALNCPRCTSTNTKFCYYNNYSLSQPRYFCKTCRRYWTEGGSLRNVPVGGGSRKNKRPSNLSSSSISTPSAPSKRVAPHVSPPDFPPQNPKIRQGHDLNLAYNPAHHYNGMSGFVTLPFSLETNTLNPNHNPSNPSSSAPHHHVMELLKNGSMSSSGLSSLMSLQVSDANSLYNSSSFPVSDFKPGLGFSLDGLGNGYGNLQGVEDDHHTNSSKTPFPFEELKPVSTGEFQQGRAQGESNQIDAGMGCWLEVLGERYTQ